MPDDAQTDPERGIKPEAGYIVWHRDWERVIECRLHSWVSKEVAELRNAINLA